MELQKIIKQWKSRKITDSTISKLLDLYLGLTAYMNEEKVYPIEIKKAKLPNHADKNFKVLDKLDMDVQTGLIICMNDELLPYSRTSWYCPVSLL